MYERHDVGTDTLHQVVRENLLTFLAAIEGSAEGGKLPSFVEAELTGRRMTQTTINLLLHVLPPQPLRQWVLTLPYELRAPLGYEPLLMSAGA